MRVVKVVVRATARGPAALGLSCDCLHSDFLIRNDKEKRIAHAMHVLIELCSRLNLDIFGILVIIGRHPKKKGDFV